MTVKQAMSAAFAISLGVLAGRASAQEPTTRCGGVEVRLIDVSYDFARNAGLDKKTKTIESTAVAAAAQGNITVVARGPVLGSMDSPKVSAELTCTGDGVALTSTITRSANYQGDVRQNELWLPRITIAVALGQSHVVLQTVWKMRLTNGQDPDHARTPPFAEEKYPITIRKTLRALK